MELKDVEKLALLSRIDIPQNELGELLSDMTAILAYVEQVESVSTAALTADIGELRNVMRDDLSPHETGMYTEVLLREAPSQEAGFVKVSQILGDANAFDA